MAFEDMSDKNLNRISYTNGSPLRRKYEEISGLSHGVSYSVPNGSLSPIKRKYGNVDVSSEQGVSYPGIRKYGELSNGSVQGVSYSCGSDSPGRRKYGSVVDGYSDQGVSLVVSNESGSPLRRKYEEVSGDATDTASVGRPSSPIVTSMPPPKKKWMKNYMEEEPSPLQGRAPPPSAPIAIPAPGLLPLPSPSAPLHLSVPAPLSLALSGAHLLDQDLPRARSNSNGSGGRAAGTREVHNKLEKNRRAHLKECFELLKRHLPASPDDKKSSNLSILDCAIKYIQMLKRREKDCEHEMERLAREKIASQQRLASLRRGSPVTPRLHHPSNHDRESTIETEEAVRSLSRVASPGSCSSLSIVHSDHLGGPISPRLSPPPSLDLTTRRSLLQQAQTFSIQTHNGAVYSQLERSPPRAKKAALARGPEAPLDPDRKAPATPQATIVHPAQLHLPITQMMNGSGLVMSPAIQMFYTTPQTLRVLQGQGGALAPIDLPSTAANSPIQRMREMPKVGEAGVGGAPLRSTQQQHIAIKPQPEGAKATLHAINSKGGIVLNGLTPFVMSKGGTHIITSSSHLTGKVINGPIIKATHQLPLTVNAQYIGSAGSVKPVVVVSSGNGLPPPASSS